MWAVVEIQTSRRCFTPTMGSSSASSTPSVGCGKLVDRLPWPPPLRVECWRLIWTSSWALHRQPALVGRGNLGNARKKTFFLLGCVLSFASLFYPVCILYRYAEDGFVVHGRLNIRLFHQLYWVKHHCQLPPNFSDQRDWHCDLWQVGSGCYTAIMFLLFPVTVLLRGGFPHEPNSGKVSLFKFSNKMF